MKTEELLEYVRTPRASRIDKGGVLYGVKILGLISRNGRRYAAEALRMGEAMYEGAAVHVNHDLARDGKPRDYRDRLGVVKNVRFVGDEGLFADLHFNPRHTVAEQLIWDAEHSAEGIGLSHHVEAVVKREGVESVVEEIVRVYSVDLVTEPAATGGLFEWNDGLSVDETMSATDWSARGKHGAESDLDGIDERGCLQAMCEEGVDARVGSEASTVLAGVTTAMHEGTQSGLSEAIREEIGRQMRVMEARVRGSQRKAKECEARELLAEAFWRPPQGAWRGDEEGNADWPRVDLAFWKELMECAGRRAMRERIAERRQWVAASARGEGCLSREPLWGSGRDEVRDGAEFARRVLCAAR